MENVYLVPKIARLARPRVVHLALKPSLYMKEFVIGPVQMAIIMMGFSVKLVMRNVHSAADLLILNVQTARMVM